MPAGLELLGDVPATVDVRVRGASGTLSRVGAGDVVAVLDLHTAQPGRRLFPLTPEQVRVPFGVEVVQVHAVGRGDGVRAVGVARRCRSCRRSTAVRRPGYVVGPLTADPRRVEVVGPESAVKRATEVRHRAGVGRRRAATPVKQTVMLGLLDPSLRLKTARSATVTVQIVPAPLERTLRNQPVHLRNLGADAAGRGGAGGRRPHACAAAATRSAASTPTIVAAFVDLAGLGPGQYSLTVHADSLARRGRDARRARQSVQVRITSGKHIDVCSAPTAFAAWPGSRRSIRRRSAGSARRWCGRCRTARESPQLLVGRDTRESGGVDRSASSRTAPAAKARR